MSINLANAKAALQSEISFLAKEQQRLIQILASLSGHADDASNVDSTPKLPYTGKKRGRKPGTKIAKSNTTADADLSKAVALVKGAGKIGIKALALAFQLKKSGNGKIGKVELLETGKIKMTGTGGGSTYSYIG